LDDRSRMNVLAGLAEAYAQEGDAGRSLSARLTLWRIQSKTDQAAPGPLATASLRRAALLRTPPEELSAAQKDELQRLCLEDALDTAAPVLEDPSAVLSAIPPNVVVLAYFAGQRTWMWRLERGVAPI